MELSEKISDLNDCLEILDELLSKLESIREAKHIYDMAERINIKLDDLVTTLDEQDT
jgi:hypothetical protein